MMTSVRYSIPLSVGKKSRDLFPKEMVNSLVSLYPKSRKWLYDKVVPEFNTTKNRKIIFLVTEDGKENKGCLILKDTPSEKKICTIWVNAKSFKAEYKDIVRILVNKAIEELKVDMPLVTLSSRCKYFETFDKVFKDYGFLLLDVKENAYLKGDKEYCYNGTLE